MHPYFMCIVNSLLRNTREREGMWEDRERQRGNGAVEKGRGLIVGTGLEYGGERVEGRTETDMVGERGRENISDV